MVKNIASFGILALTISTLLYFSFRTNESFDSSKYSTEGLDLDYTVSLEVIDESTAPEKYNEEIFTPYLGKSFVGFKEALAFKESRGKYSVVNTYGYLGKYQFGKGTLKLLGVHNPDQFLNSPRLQENAFIANTARNKWILRRDIKNFVGKRVNGIVVTESGILAAAHLAGPGSVKKYLRSYGIDNFSDGYGTTVGYYMKRFSGYDTSFIKPDKKAKAI
ncbi:peptidoglycan-binding protein LysM [Tamlana sp. 2_MG-2023]|uniref:peptidoglycan-binding protein LysM n=1 Tax=unclassified Tamlana TaxID=2614803 RepID=UPI0026E2E068|nr:MULTISPECIES: peptidoglycan-binding protein LysM [unclassified Tamlana]MDO6759085.1 peptidoglycan-binding protein LysM [Tamlana sp. 2_MG-2023]MDO6789784.1 peptidoglycan-binding protein LysM [Tamlana sp. 1_MG-2023]